MNERDPPIRHMTDAAFDAAGREVLAQITTYWQRVRAADPALPVRCVLKPGEFAARIPASPPEMAEPLDRILNDAATLLPDAVTHWQHPMFFGYFPANISAPAVLADLLCSGLGVQGMLWSTGPACTELETRMLDWMAQALGLPESFHSTSRTGGGVIQGTASDAALVAVVAARHRARAGGRAGPYVLYGSSQAHSSLVKAALIAGLVEAPPAPSADSAWSAAGSGVRLIACDETGAMRAEALAAAMNADTAAGRVPLLVFASIGTTASCARDPLEQLALLASTHSAWLHVDAAYAGSACVCPEHRHLLAGVEHADSLAMNPHKWLLTNFDCGLMWTRDRQALTGSMSITPEYLRNAASDAGAVWDYRDWHVPLGRRFRSLKLWFVLRAYGLAGLRSHIREHVRLAVLFESLARADARFEVVMPRGCGLSLICFRLREPPGTDTGTRTLMERLNASGRMFLTHAVLPPATGAVHPRYVIRMAIGGVFTHEEHVRAAWERIRHAAEGLGG